VKEQELEEKRRKLEQSVDDDIKYGVYRDAEQYRHEYKQRGC